ncbi:hypothetical protein ASG01_14320 [Chryseobacterium sp. Leaf180]|uniref:hypothetical protein n=1 Tax=Chryseobacterium sp. Leaf180 TaxID=1736289 RepID=UPI0006FC0054|nr:hypothetical protein [Chryseobacterium sp. Leaf180]KQR91061.1 hypothetical protein ASG01_14320 [Chryseobacterium sp. Leaf180]
MLKAETVYLSLAHQVSLEVLTVEIKWYCSTVSLVMYLLPDTGYIMGIESVEEASVKFIDLNSPKLPALLINQTYSTL